MSAIKEYVFMMGFGVAIGYLVKSMCHELVNYPELKERLLYYSWVSTTS